MFKEVGKIFRKKKSTRLHGPNQVLFAYHIPIATRLGKKKGLAKSKGHK